MTVQEYIENHPDDFAMNETQIDRFIQDTIDKFINIMEIEFNRAELDILKEERLIKL